MILKPYFKITKLLPIHLHIPPNIFSNNIKFQIHRMSHRQIPKSRMFKSIRNNRYTKMRIVRIDYRQAHPVDTNRSFVHQQMLRIFRIRKTVIPTPVRTNTRRIDSPALCVHLVEHWPASQPNLLKKSKFG